LTVDAILAELKALGSETNRAGMARFGINVTNAFGVSVKEIRRIGKMCGRDHELALQLWATGNHEARVLASVVDLPRAVTSAQMDAWIQEFNSWDLCDQCCGNLFDKTPFAWKKAAQWSRLKPEFEKRAGFALMAGLARHDRVAPDAQFVALLPLIEKQSGDERNYVWKAVNWALREIGKRNPALRQEAMACAHRILETDTRAGRWIARDALRELAGKEQSPVSSS
jgi:3-methyladenine DNA glycosylase AlkD